MTENNYNIEEIKIINKQIVELTIRKKLEKASLVPWIFPDKWI